jgi:hypothetical protein
LGRSSKRLTTTGCERVSANARRYDTYKPAYATQAEKLCRLGATDVEHAEFFGVSVRTVSAWKTRHVDFLQALKAGKTEADDCVKRALYHRAVGYSHKVEKPMVIDKDLRIVTYTERMAPDTTACIFWLKNRRPDEWRGYSPASCAFHPVGMP